MMSVMGMTPLPYPPSQIPVPQPLFLRALPLLPRGGRMARRASLGPFQRPEPHPTHRPDSRPDALSWFRSQEGG